KLGRKRIFGTHKTLRGFFFGILAAIGMAFLQSYLYTFHFFSSISIIEYPLFNPALVGFLFGFGALFGDAVKSFFKRRVGISEGEPWLVFDQTDWIIGALIFISPVSRISPTFILLTLGVFIMLHFAFKIIGYYLGIDSKKI
ncbi:hypothetical protein COY95_04525, partial [Candidatus Woesearchaeota archaeon CG_4_10_14_0_8_um_filter_47_5]